MKEDLKVIYETIQINCSVQKAWDAWTTESGIKGFFARDCKIEISPGGAYEMYFLTDNEPGSKGGEGNVILAVEPMQLLSFTWNAPPQYPHVRPQRTSVCIRFLPIDEEQVEIILEHTGWGFNDEWQQVFEYFQKAWGEMVLPNLKQYLENN